MRFVVHGMPATQGSKRGFVTGGKVVLVETSSKLKPWRAQVAAEAAASMNGAELLTGPVALEVDFVFPRPKSHFRTGKNASVLKQDAPDYVTSRSLGDLDKLVRAICDSLSGIVFLDDSQVVSLIAAKRYGASAKAIIGVRRTPQRGTSKPS